MSRFKDKVTFLRTHCIDVVGNMISGAFIYKNDELLLKLTGEDFLSKDVLKEVNNVLKAKERLKKIREEQRNAYEKSKRLINVSSVICINIENEKLCYNDGTYKCPYILNGPCGSYVCGRFRSEIKFEEPSSELPYNFYRCKECLKSGSKLKNILKKLFLT